MIEDNKYLEGVVRAQQEQIEQLLETVAHYENDAAASRPRANP